MSTTSQSINVWNQPHFQSGLNVDNGALIVTQSATVNGGTHNYGGINVGGTSSFGYASNSSLTYTSNATQVGLELRGYGTGTGSGPAAIFHWENTNNILLWNNSKGWLTVQAGNNADGGYPANLNVEGQLTAGTTVKATNGFIATNGSFTSGASSFQWIVSGTQVGTLDGSGNLAVIGRVRLGNNTTIPGTVPTGGLTFVNNGLYYTNGSTWVPASHIEAYSQELKGVLHFENSVISTRGTSGTFSRSTWAWGPDAVEWGANDPRFVQGTFGSAVFLEEGTSNILTANESTPQNDLTGIVPNYNNGTVTVTRDTTQSWTGSGASINVVNSGTSSYTGVRIGSFTLTSGTTYTASAYVKGAVGGESLALAFSHPQWDTSKNFIATNTWQRVSVEFTPTSTGQFYIEVGQHNATFPTTFNVDGVQVEAKPYPTTWVMGASTRAEEKLTYPSNLINNGPFSIFCYAAQNVSTSNWQMLIDGRNNGPSMAFGINNSDKLQLTWYDAGGAQHSLIGPTVTGTSTHHYGLVFDGSNMKTYLDGAVVAATTGTSVKFDANNYFLVGNSIAHETWNGWIDELAIFQIALSDVQVHNIYAANQPIIDLFASSNGSVNGSVPSTTPVPYDLVQYDGSGDITANSLTLNNNFIVTDSVTVQQSSWFTNNATVDNALVVSGTATIYQNTTMNGALELNSNMTVQGPTQINSTLNATGNTTIGGNIVGSGTASFGATTVSGTLTATGNVTTSGNWVYVYDTNHGMYSDGTNLALQSSKNIFLSGYNVDGTRIESGGHIRLGGPGQIGSKLYVQSGGLIDRSTHTLNGTGYFFYPAHNTGGSNGTGTTLQSGTIITDTTSSYGTIVRVSPATANGATIFNGPYTSSVPGGQYLYVVRVRVSSTSENISAIYFDAHSNTGGWTTPTIYVNPSQFPDTTNWHTLTHSVNIPAGVTDLELRAYSSNPTASTNIDIDYVALILADEQYSSLPNGVTFLNNLSANGNLTISGTSALNGTTTVGTSSSTSGAALIVNGGVQLANQWGNVWIGTGQADMTWDGGVDGAFTLKNTSTINGAYTLIQGNNTSGSSVSTLKLWNNGLTEVVNSFQVDGATTFKGTVATSNNTLEDGSGNMTVGGNLTTSGTITSKGNLVIQNSSNYIKFNNLAIQSDYVQSDGNIRGAIGQFYFDGTNYQFMPGNSSTANGILFEDSGLIRFVAASGSVPSSGSYSYMKNNTKFWIYPNGTVWTFNNLVDDDSGNGWTYGSLTTGRANTTPALLYNSCFPTTGQPTIGGSWQSTQSWGIGPKTGSNDGTLQIGMMYAHVNPQNTVYASGSWLSNQGFKLYVDGGLSSTKNILDDGNGNVTISGTATINGNTTVNGTMIVAGNSGGRFYIGSVDGSNHMWFGTNMGTGEPSNLAFGWTTNGSGNITQINLGGVSGQSVVTPKNVLDDSSGNVKFAGAVQQVSGVTTHGYFGVPTVVANQLDMALSNTNPTNVVSFTPSANGNYIVYVYFRVTTATTNVTVNITYNDSGGSQTHTLVNNIAETTGSYSSSPLYINAVSGTPIIVQATAGTANQVYVSSTILGL